MTRPKGISNAHVRELLFNANNAATVHLQVKAEVEGQGGKMDDTFSSMAHRNLVLAEAMYKELLKDGKVKENVYKGCPGSSYRARWSREVILENFNAETAARELIDYDPKFTVNALDDVHPSDFHWIISVVIQGERREVGNSPLYGSYDLCRDGARAYILAYTGKEAGEDAGPRGKGGCLTTSI